MSRVYRGKNGKLYDGLICYIFNIPSPILGCIDAGVKIGKFGMDYVKWQVYNAAKMGRYADRGLKEGLEAYDEQTAQLIQERIEQLFGDRGKDL